MPDPISVRIADGSQSATGWYDLAGYNLIKALTRIKYNHVREKDEPAPDSLCFQTIENYEKEKASLEQTDETDSEEDDRGDVDIDIVDNEDDANVEGEDAEGNEVAGGDEGEGEEEEDAEDGNDSGEGD